MLSTICRTRQITTERKLCAAHTVKDDLDQLSFMAFLGPLASTVLHDITQLLKVSAGFLQVNNQCPFVKPFVIGSNPSSRAETPRSVKKQDLSVQLPSEDF